MLDVDQNRNQHRLNIHKPRKGMKITGNESPVTRQLPTKRLPTRIAEIPETSTGCLRYKFRKLSEPVAREMSHKSSVRFLWRNGEPCWSAGWRTGEFVGRGGSTGGWMIHAEVQPVYLHLCHVAFRDSAFTAVRSILVIAASRVPRALPPIWNPKPSDFLLSHRASNRNFLLTFYAAFFSFFLSFFFFSLLSIDRLTLPIRFLTRRADE